MGKRVWLKYATIVVGLGAIMGLLWFAAPLVALGDSHPFDNPVMKLGAVGLAGFGTLSYFIYDMQARWYSAKALANSLTPTGGIPGLGGGAGGSASGSGAEAQAPQDDSATLQTRMSDALATLKKASSPKGDYLYDLPWYVIIGPPGSGKTTALVNSGLKFPLSRGGVRPAAIAGEGGTRYCDWWFTEDAVLIDTAGRYTTQDSDARTDKSSWLAFLDLLKKNRPKQPVNGVMVCISVEDVLTLPANEVRAHADAIRARLMELHDQLKVDFPVYVLFTKADLISGFMEFFGTLNEAGRNVVWGCTFQTNDKTANMVNDVPAEFDLLIERLNRDVVDRVQEEPTPTGRVQIFGFPSQVAALKQPVFDFLNLIFEPTRYHSNATLRGFYFTSGTQQGTPIDQLVGALARSFGTQDMGAIQYSGQGKSFFLTDLLQKVIFEEAGWVSTNVKAVRRSMILKGLGYAALAAACIGLGAAWWISYGRNTTLIGDTYASVAKYKTGAGPLRDETTINDNDFKLVEPALAHLRNMPAGFAVQNDPVPLQATFGLNQKPRLSVSALQAYDTGLQRLLRPRLMFRMESLMRDNITNPGYLSSALKVYLMVAGKEPIDRALVSDWWRRDFETLYPSATNAAGRAALLQHVDRLMQLDPPEGPAAIDVDNNLVQAARAAIGRMTVADRAFEIMRAEALKESDKDWIFRKKAGQDAALVFEGQNGADLDQIRVPYFYTYDGFQKAFLAKVDQVADQVRKERHVLGDVADQDALKTQYEQLPQGLSARYTKEFIAAWQNELKKLRIKLLTADKPKYTALLAAASPTSPITQIIEAIRAETALTKEKDGQKPADPPKPDPNAAPKLNPFGNEVPGAAIEQYFRPYALLVEGDRSKRPVDELIGNLNDVYQGLSKLNDPTLAAEGRVKFADGLKSLQATATRFPEPFKALIQNAAASFDSDATGTTVARIQASLTEQVTTICQQTISGMYPFTRGSSKDISVQDMQKLFGPNGIIDRYFTTNLAQYANTSGPSWSWIQANPVGRQLSPGMLQSFQQAASIKQAFFPGGAPGFSFAVKNLAIGQDIETARLEINSGQLNTDRPPPPPAPPAPSLFGAAPPPPPPAPPPAPSPVVTFQWPGPVGMGGASLTLLPEIPLRANVLQKQGVWGVFRLLDSVSVTPAGQALIARISVGGREAQYQFSAVTLPNPFTLPALRSFTCPVAR